MKPLAKKKKAAEYECFTDAELKEVFENLPPMPNLTGIEISIADYRKACKDIDRINEEIIEELKLLKGEL